nr:NAD(P)-binding protein [uncultured Sulfurimonas sp.]
MFEYAVVGSGVGGSSIASYLDAKGKRVALFEKEPYLGGCSSSFTHGKFSYNTGATTLAGYQDGFVVKEVFEDIGFKPKLMKTDPTIVLIQDGKITPRYKDFEKFLGILEKNYPHPQNREFWTLVYEVNKEFYKHNGHYYSNKNIFAKVCSLTSFIPLGLSFFKYFKVNAYEFIDDFFYGIGEDYLQFLESQILIVAQAPTKEINFLTAVLALGYTFNDNYYVVGGFSQLFDDMTKNIKDIYRDAEVLSIEKKSDCFELYTKDEIFRAKKVILNSTVYDSAKLFGDAKIQEYYKSYEKLNNHQSSFMLYMTIKSEQKFEHHYQLIQEEKFPHTLSQALFVSFSDADDDVLAPKGHYSVTASIHTDTRFWQDAQKYKEQKKELKKLLLDRILKDLNIKKEEIVASFAATPNSFERYIKRSQLGGNAISMKNFLPFLPSNDTKIKGLYNVGDSVYAAQGWPGVMMGVKNLQRLLNV